MLNEIKFTFKREYAVFRTMYYLIDSLLYFDMEEFQINLKKCIKQYNLIIEELEQYKKIEQQIHETDYSKRKIKKIIYKNVRI